MRAASSEPRNNKVAGRLKRASQQIFQRKICCGRGVARLTRRPVTAEIAGSNPVARATNKNPLMGVFVSRLTSVKPSCLATFLKTFCSGPPQASLATTKLRAAFGEPRNIFLSEKCCGGRKVNKIFLPQNFLKPSGFNASALGKLPFPHHPFPFESCSPYKKIPLTGLFVAGAGFEPATSRL